MAFSGGSNAVLVNNCQNLQNLTVTLQVTQDLITLGDTGFSLQLNCYPPPGVTSVGLTLNWIQYTLYVSNNTGAFQWQAWALGATGWPQGQPQGTTQSQQPVPPFSQPNAVIATVPSNRLPAGSSLTIALTTAPSSQRVTAATFTVQLAGAAAKSVTLDFPASVPFNFVTGAPGVPVDAQFPIAGFQVDLVGPGNLATAAFTSGAGEITYSVSSGSGLSVQNGGVGTACGQYTGALTGENSNVVYGDVTPSSGATVRQPFSVPVATNVSSFQPVQPGNMAIYVLGSDGNLWFETGPFGHKFLRIASKSMRTFSRFRRWTETMYLYWGATATFGSRLGRSETSRAQSKDAFNWTAMSRHFKRSSRVSETRSSFSAKTGRCGGSLGPQAT